MTAEITASILIGPLRADSTHGQVFAPSHVLVLMENSRATWIVQRCPELRGASPSTRIRPATPAHLLAAALLGYTALAAPEALEAAGRLRALTAPEKDGSVAVEQIDDDLAAHAYDYCTKHVYGAVTRLPGSTLGEKELRMAEEAGLLVAEAKSAHARGT